MFIIDYSKIIVRKIIIANIICVLIGLLLYFAYNETGLIFCLIISGLIMSTAMSFTHYPSFNSKLAIDENNKTFHLTKYPIAIPDDRAKNGYLFKNMTTDISFNDISDYYIANNKIFFVLNNGHEFFIQANYVKQITSIQCLIAKKSDIGKIVELTNADYNDGTIIYSGKIVDIMYYKPYKRVCTIVDTRGFINSALSEDRGNTIVLFNRYYGDKLTGNRVVNVLVPKNDVIISDEKECLEYSDFFVFCDLKYKK